MFKMTLELHFRVFNLCSLVPSQMDPSLAGCRVQGAVPMWCTFVAVVNSNFAAHPMTHGQWTVVSFCVEIPSKSTCWWQISVSVNPQCVENKQWDRASTTARTWWCHPLPKHKTHIKRFKTRALMIKEPSLCTQVASIIQWKCSDQRNPFWMPRFPCWQAWLESLSLCLFWNESSQLQFSHFLF